MVNTTKKMQNRLFASYIFYAKSSKNKKFLHNTELSGCFLRDFATMSKEYKAISSFQGIIPQRFIKTSKLTITITFYQKP